MQKTVRFCLRYALSLARYWMRCVPATRKTRFAIAPDFRYLYTRRIQQTVHETILTRRMHASGRRQIFVLRKRRRRSLRHAHGPRMGRRPRILTGRLCARQLCLLRGRRLRKRRTPLRRQRTPARHAQHPVGRLRRHGSICRANCAGSTSAAACRQPISTSEAAITTGSRSTCANTAAPIIYNDPRILRESGDFHYSLRVTPEI